MPSPIKFTEVAPKIMDRTLDVRATSRELLDAWGFDLDTRKPGLAYIDEAGKPVTTLDMACLLSELVDWGSVINLETYRAAGPATKRAGEIVLSKKNRHGKIVGLVSNVKRFNLSLRIFDMGILGAHEVGAYRTFMLMQDGEWHGGFDGLQFLPDAEENKKLARIAQADNVMTFEYLVNPNRWTSIYGSAYMAAKLMIERLAEEKKWLDNEIKKARAALKIPPESYEPSERVGKSSKKTVWAVQVEVDGLTMTGAYAEVLHTQDALELATTHRTRVNSYLERLRFQTRATEWAFWKKICDRYGADNVVALCEGEIGTEKIPMASWAKTGTGWTSTRATDRSKGWLTCTAHGYTMRLRQWEMTVDAAATEE